MLATSQYIKTYDNIIKTTHYNCLYLKLFIVLVSFYILCCSCTSVFFTILLFLFDCFIVVLFIFSFKASDELLGLSVTFTMRPSFADEMKCTMYVMVSYCDRPLFVLRLIPRSIVRYMFTLG